VSLRQACVRGSDPISPGNRSGQNPANRGSTDLQPAGDFGFADARTVQFPYLASLESSGDGPAQFLPVLPGVGQASPDPFPQDFSFELRENSEQPGHGSTGWRRQIQRFGQRDETNTEMLQFLECHQQVRYRPAPAVQPPNQHHVDLPAARSLQYSLAGFSLCRAGANVPDLHGDGPAPPSGIFPQGAILHW